MDKETSVKFVVLTFLLTYCAWGSIIVANQFGYLKYGTPISMILFLVGGNAPPIISYILLRRDGTYKSFRDFLKATCRFRQPVINYLIVFGFTILYFVVPLIMHDIDFGAPFYISILIIPLMVLGGGLEELGWRLILQPLLERKLPFVVATIITGIIWTLWHLPLFFIEGTNQFGTSYLMFAVSTLGIAFALAAVYRTGKNIWLCILFHSMINAFWETFKLKQSPLVVVITAILMISTSVGVVMYNKHSKSYMK